MYAFANDGSEFNNERFSPCSIEMMNNVIAVNGQGPQPRKYVLDSSVVNAVLDDMAACVQLQYRWLE